MKTEKIVLLGGGGHCKVVVDLLRKLGGYEIVGIVDNKQSLSDLSGAAVIGDDAKLADVFASGCQQAFIAVGSIGDPTVRIKLAKMLKETGFTLPVLVHPSAVVAENVELQEGALVCAGVVIGPGASIGANAIINTKASVDHDCRIGDFVHLAPGVTISADVIVGDNSHIGVGASVIQNINIGTGVLIGAGGVVVRDVRARAKAVGIPCKVVGENRG